MKSLYDSLPQNILKRRKELKLTQARVAERADVPLRTYQDIEMGKSWPQRHTLAAISHALEIDERALAGAQDATALTPAIDQAIRSVVQALGYEPATLRLKIPETLQLRVDAALARTLQDLSALRPDQTAQVSRLVAAFAHGEDREPDPEPPIKMRKKPKER